MQACPVNSLKMFRLARTLPHHRLGFRSHLSMGKKTYNVWSSFTAYAESKSRIAPLIASKTTNYSEECQLTIDLWLGFTVTTWAGSPLSPIRRHCFNVRVLSCIRDYIRFPSKPWKQPSDDETGSKQPAQRLPSSLQSPIWHRIFSASALDKRDDASRIFWSIGTISVPLKTMYGQGREQTRDWSLSREARHAEIEANEQD